MQVSALAPFSMQKTLQESCTAHINKMSLETKGGNIE